MRLCLCNPLKTSRSFVNVIFPPLPLSPWGADYILEQCLRSYWPESGTQ